jgi:probable DNA metabolism protein
MTVVRLHSEIDFSGWRAAARDLRITGVAPGQVQWKVDAGRAAGLAEADAPGFEVEGADPLIAPREFLGMAQAAVCHRDPGRFDRLYRLLWRLQTTPRLLEMAADPDVAELHRLAAEVTRACQKMKAFLRFRLVEEDPETYAGWYEPAHRVLQRTAPFFAHRFSSLRFMILTPEASCSWDGSALSFSKPDSWNPPTARFIPDLTD